MKNWEKTQRINQIQLTLSYCKNKNKGFTRNQAYKLSLQQLQKKVKAVHQPPQNDGFIRGKFLENMIENLRKNESQIQNSKFQLSISTKERLKLPADYMDEYIESGKLPRLPQLPISIEEEKESLSSEYSFH